MNRSGSPVQSATVSLAGDASSVPVARRFVQSQLEGWGHDEAAWTAAQIISELATNCALHARTEYTVTVTVQGDCARLEVRDGSPVNPRPRAYGATATTGRGLQLVGEFARDWGVEQVPPGKSIWVLISLTPEAADDTDDEKTDAVISALLRGLGGDTPSTVRDRVAA